MVGRSLEELWKNELRCEVFSPGCFYGQLGVWGILSEADVKGMVSEYVRQKLSESRRPMSPYE